MKKEIKSMKNQMVESLSKGDKKGFNEFMSLKLAATVNVLINLLGKKGIIPKMKEFDVLVKTNLKCMIDVNIEAFMQANNLKTIEEVKAFKEKQLSTQKPTYVG